jgi:hypothetical protein
MSKYETVSEAEISAGLSATRTATWEAAFWFVFAIFCNLRQANAVI